MKEGVHLFLSHGDRRNDMMRYLEQLPRGVAPTVECNYAGDVDLTWAFSPDDRWRELMLTKAGWVEGREGAPLPMPDGTYKRWLNEAGK
jgi:hypothetical protein